jgi:hypothetical protein
MWTRLICVLMMSSRTLVNYDGDNGGDEDNKEEEG